MIQTRGRSPQAARGQRATWRCNYITFPSSRVYAVGKVEMRRAHTKGRSPATGRHRNKHGVAVCAMGNWHAEQATASLLQGIRLAVEEIRGFSCAASPEIPAHPHA